jgi:hypothetical protein
MKGKLFLGGKMFKKLIPILLFTTLCLPAHSLFEDALQKDPSSSARFNYELNGYVRGVFYVGPIPEKSGYQTKDKYGEAALKLRLRTGRIGDAYGELRFRNVNNSEGSASAITLREAYVNAYLGAFDLRIGQQIVLWGKSDGYNPTNVITPLDLLVFSPDEDDRRISNFLIRAYYNWSVLRLEAIWVPVYESSVLPFSKVELPEGIQLGQPNYPDNAIEHSAIALKLHYEGASLDATLSYFNGLLPMPGLSACTENSILTIYPTAYRNHMLGADFSTTVGPYGLRGEFAYREPYEKEDTWQSIPNRQVEYILGVDREFGNFSMIVQYIGKHVFDYEELAQVDQSSPDFIKYKIALWNRILSGQLKKWTHAISFRLAWKLYHETLSLEILGQINLSTKEAFFKPKLSYELADNLALTMGVQIYHGPDDTLFGLLDKINSAGFIELKASF